MEEPPRHVKAMNYVNYAEVNELIPKAEERDAIFKALETYQLSLDLVQLVDEMMKYIDEPIKLEIYEYLRPLIPPKHQVEYDKLAPPPAGQKLRVINLRRRQNESLGFAVRGGFEHGIGVFVSQVTAGSQADLQGLKVGDEIVRVNGFTIAEAIHEEVLSLIKSYNQIELKVTNIGMLPVKDKADDAVTWKYVERAGINRRSRDGGRRSSNQTDKEAEEVKVFINLRTAPSLGCSIISGPRHFPGIYVEVVKQNSLAEKVGMEAGDQILKVNDTSFIDITHKEAVVALKSSKELIVVLRKHVGIPLIQAGSSAMNRQAYKPSSPSLPPVADDDSFAQNDRVLDKDDIYNTRIKIETNNNVNKSEHVVSSYSSENKKQKSFDIENHSDMEEMEEVIQIVDVVESEVKIYREPSVNDEDETAERLQKLLQTKLDQNKKEAELLRMQTFEENRKKRQSLEKDLLLKIEKNSKNSREELRLYRHKQEEEEMLRESKGEMDDILSGRGSPLKKSNLGLLGNPNKTEQSSSENDDIDLMSNAAKSVSPTFDTDKDVVQQGKTTYSVITYVSADRNKLKNYSL